MCDEQNEDDADGDRARGRALQGEIHQVIGGEEIRVEDLEDGPDENKADDYGERAQVAAAHARAEIQDRAAESFATGDSLVEGVGQALERGLRVGGRGHEFWSSETVWALALRVTALSVAPVMAEMISS